MKAIQISRPGGPEVLEPASVSSPSPEPSEVLIQVEAAGVNFIDTYHRTGAYPVQLPFIPGVEGGGTVTEVGSEVDGVKAGDRVTYALHLGSYAEQATVPAAHLLPVPDGVDIGSAVAATVQGLTAHYLSRSTYRLTPEATALVHAAAGGVGRLLVQMARIVGAEVFATVSNETKAKVAREAGAQHVIDYSREDFVERVQDVTHGRGVDVVYDSVGLDTFQSSLKCLRPRGLLCLFGQSSGAVPPVDPQILNSAGSVFLTRPSLHHYSASREELLERGAEVYRWMKEGTLSVRIDRTFRLEEAADAHRALESRATMGKILLLNE